MRTLVPGFTSVGNVKENFPSLSVTSALPLPPTTETSAPLTRFPVPSSRTTPETVISVCALAVGDQSESTMRNRMRRFIAFASEMSHCQPGYGHPFQQDGILPS